MSTNMNTNTPQLQQHTVTSTPRNERPATNDRRAASPRERSSQDIIANPPPGWLVTVVELDPSASQDKRLRLRMMVFEHPDKGYRMLPFLTRRTFKRMSTEHGEVETPDDVDILPMNPLEAALPAITVAPYEVLENLTTVMAEYGRKQAELPPPSKKPVTHRPFNTKSMSAIIKTTRNHPPEPQLQTVEATRPQRNKKPQQVQPQHRNISPINRQMQRELDITLFYL